MLRVLRSALVLFVFASWPPVLSSQAQRGGFNFLGEWSDVSVTEGDDPHAYGNALDLWKNGDDIVGVLNEYSGSVADPAIGLLQDVTLDAASGRLSFAVKMTLGATWMAGRKEFVPTRDLYMFKGSFSDQEVGGSLEKQDRLENTAPATRVVVWKRARRDGSPNQTFADWQTFYAPILKARGPKW